MAQYSPRKLVRSISKPLLQRYFNTQRYLAEFDWAAYSEGDPRPIIDALEAMSTDERESVETDFAMVMELATDGGSQLIYEEGTFWKRPWVQKLQGLANDCERAMLALIEDRRLLDRALAYNEIDRFGEGRWQRWPVGKRLQVTDDQDGLLKELRTIFKEQGRGARCHIETFDRRDPERFCCFAYPEDYPKTDLGYDDKNRFSRQTRRNATEIIFVYRREDGVLEMMGKGDKKQKDKIAEAFCTTMLGLKALPDPRANPPYDLSVLKRRDFSFKTDPADNVESVEVRLLRFDLPGKGYRRLVLSARPTPEVPAVLHALVEEAIDKAKFPLSELHVSQAKLSMRFRGQDGRRGKTLTFEVTYPDRCNLKDNGHDAVAKRYLTKWGIASA